MYSRDTRWETHTTHSQLLLVGTKPPHPVLDLSSDKPVFFLQRSSVCITSIRVFQHGIKDRNVKKKITAIDMIKTGRCCPVILTFCWKVRNSFVFFTH